MNIDTQIELPHPLTHGRKIVDGAQAQLAHVTEPTFEELMQAQHRLLYLQELAEKIDRISYRHIADTGKRLHKMIIHIDLGIKQDSMPWNPENMGIDWRSGDLKLVTS